MNEREKEYRGYYAVITASDKLIVGELNGYEVPLEFMRKTVGGFIERVPSPIDKFPFDYYVDDEGMFKHPLNLTASGIIFVNWNCNIRQGIYGDMLVLAHDGDIIRPLTKEEVDTITKRYEVMHEIVVKHKEMRNIK